MAIWADLDADDDVPPNPPIVTTADQSNAEIVEEQGSSSYIAHALRCYPYAQGVGSLIREY